MKTVCITAFHADENKQSCIEKMNYYHASAIGHLKHRVSLDHALVRAMQDDSVPITDDLRDTKSLLSIIAEDIRTFHIFNKRYVAAFKFLEHPVRARIETCSEQEFDQIVLHDKDSILNDIKDVRVGDAVDFVMCDAEGACVKISRVYLDINHNWVPAYDDQYITDWKSSLSDPSTTYKLFLAD